MIRMSRGFAALVASMALVVFVAGCGDDEGESTSAGGGSTTTETQPAEGGGKEAAQAAVDKFQDMSSIEWPQPEEAFDPGQGKVAVISCGNAGINCLKGSEDAKAAAEAMGWESSPIFDGEFTPAKQAGFVQQAIQQNYDAIILVSIDANSIKAAVDAAAAKDIPIACVMCVNPEFEGKVYDVSSGGVSEGEAIGAWAAANVGDGKIVAFDDKSFPIVAARRENALKKVAEFCPDCEVEKLDFPTSDLSKPGAPTFTGMLSANPSGTLDIVMAPYDPAAIPFAKAAEQQGRDDFQMSGYDASPDYLTMIKDGTGGAAATTAAPFPYASWGAMDQVARIKAGAEPWESNLLPSVLVTKENADEFTPDGFLEPDFDYKAKFQELWGGGA